LFSVKPSVLLCVLEQPTVDNFSGRPPPLELSTVGWSRIHNNTLQVLQRTIGPPLELSTVGCSSTHNNTLQVLQRTIGPHAGVIYWRFFKYTQQHTAVLQRTIYCRLFKYIQQHAAVLQRTIGPHAGVIYCRLFKYTQQYTAGFTENNWAPRWSYLLSVFQVHTTTHCMFYREQLGPTLELSTAGCSSTHKQHTAVLQRTIGPHAGVIYCRLFKYIQQHAAVLQRTTGPHAGVIYCRCSSTHKTCCVYLNNDSR
jgi:hypothetical protein